METTKNIIIVFALVLSVTPAAISEEFKISDTRRASCVVQITTDRIAMPLNSGTIESLIRSSGVLGKAAREILESTLEEPELKTNNKNGIVTKTMNTYTFELNVELPEGARPIAKEFITAMVDNLRESLNEAYQVYRQYSIEQLISAQQQYDEAESQLNNATEYTPKILVIPIDTDISDDIAVQTQLEQEVDLSDITPETSFAEIIDRLRHAVEPPLQIQPNWRDLYDMADIDRETPCEMDPLTGVKLGKALDVLLEGLSVTNVIELGYIIDDGVITIATKDTLPNNMVTVLYDISGLVNSSGDTDSIERAIMETIEPESWFDPDKIDTENINNNSRGSLGGYGINNIPQEIIDNGDGKIVIMQGNKLSIYNTPEIHEKITNFLANFPIDFSDEPAANIPLETLLTDKQDVERQKRQLELEVARLGARQAAAEQQILAVSSKVKDDTNATELKNHLNDLIEKLNELKKTRAEQHPEVQAIQKRIEEIKTKISSVEEDPIISELERFIESQNRQLETFRMQSEFGVMSPNELAAAEEKLMQAKIQLAKRREELARPTGVGNLGALNENLSMAILDLAEKKAELKVVDKQLSEIEGRIRAASTTDPNILKIRQEKQALERAAKRLNELKIIEETLQPPKVITIGI